MAKRGRSNSHFSAGRGGNDYLGSGYSEEEFKKLSTSFPDFSGVGKSEIEDAWEARDAAIEKHADVSKREFPHSKMWSDEEIKSYASDPEVIRTSMHAAGLNAAGPHPKSHDISRSVSAADLDEAVSNGAFGGNETELEPAYHTNPRGNRVRSFLGGIPVHTVSAPLWKRAGFESSEEYANETRSAYAKEMEKEQSPDYLKEESSKWQSDYENAATEERASLKERSIHGRKREAGHKLSVEEMIAKGMTVPEGVEVPHRSSTRASSGIGKFFDANGNPRDLREVLHEARMKEPMWTEPEKPVHFKDREENKDVKLTPAQSKKYDKEHAIAMAQYNKDYSESWDKHVARHKRWQNKHKDVLDAARKIDPDTYDGELDFSDIISSKSKRVKAAQTKEAEVESGAMATAKRWVEEVAQPAADKEGIHVHDWIQKKAEEHSVKGFIPESSVSHEDQAPGIALSILRAPQIAKAKAEEETTIYEVPPAAKRKKKKITDEGALTQDEKQAQDAADAQRRADAAADAKAEPVDEKIERYKAEVGAHQDFLDKFTTKVTKESGAVEYRANKLDDFKKHVRENPELYPEIPEEHRNDDLALATHYTNKISLTKKTIANRRNQLPELFVKDRGQKLISSPTLQEESRALTTAPYSVLSPGTTTKTGEVTAEDLEEKSANIASSKDEKAATELLKFIYSPESGLKGTVMYSPDPTSERMEDAPRSLRVICLNKECFNTLTPESDSNVCPSCDANNIDNPRVVRGGPDKLAREAIADRTATDKLALGPKLAKDVHEKRQATAKEKLKEATPSNFESVRSNIVGTLTEPPSASVVRQGRNASLHDALEKASGVTQPAEDLKADAAAKRATKEGKSDTIDNLDDIEDGDDED